MNLYFILLAVFCYRSVQAHYSEAELTEALEELSKKSNEECLREAAYINKAIAAGHQSKLKDIPDKPIEPKDVNFVLYTGLVGIPTNYLRRNHFLSEDYESSEYLRENLNNSMPQNLSATNNYTLGRSNYAKWKLTYIYIHGSMDSYRGNRSQAIVKELLKCFNINVIIVDWSSYSYRNLTYSRNVTTTLVGKICGKFLRLLLSNGVNINLLHLSGHSTGAQAAGICAKAVKKILRITAIDPVGPCFINQPFWNRLAKTDAVCVQIIHCSTGSRGVPLNYTGTVDFYVKGGVYQQQCYGYDLDQVSLCSHNACIDYFIYALKNFHQFVGIKCKSYEEYKRKNCDYRKTAIGGFYAACSKTGLYFVDICPFSHANSYDLQWYY